MSLTVIDPKSRTPLTVASIDQFNYYVVSGGYVPIHADNTAMQVNSFEGGYLVDGAPLNVWLSGYWYDGQQDILASFWNSGQIPKPPAQLLALPSIPAPADVVANYAAQKGVPGATTLVQAFQQGSSIGAGISPVMLIGGAVVLMLLFRK